MKYEKPDIKIVELDSIDIVTISRENGDGPAEDMFS